MILVNENNFEEALGDLSGASPISIDTETTGKYPYQGDKLFSVIVANAKEEYYFDFHRKTGMPRNLIGGFEDIFSDPQRRYYFVNAKFDLAILANDNVQVQGRIIDGGVLARVHWNDHPEKYFSAEYLTNFYLPGLLKKDLSVKQYIKENGLYQIDPYGKQAPDYTLVPLDMMFPYGCNDGRIHYDLCEEILRRIVASDKLNEKTRPKSYQTQIDLVRREVSLTKTLFQIESRGANVDEPYTIRAREYEFEKGTRIKSEVEKALGININSSKQLSKYLIGQGYDLPKTKKGNYKTDAETLEEYVIGDPYIDRIFEARRALKKANTYYKNFLDLRDAKGLLHCSFNQDVARTGRLSCSKPNLQNLTKERWTGKEEYLVRKSIIPTPGRKLFMFDYKQQEMHIIVDAAGEMSVIEKMRDGYDFYDATARTIYEMLGIKIDRPMAKALSLGIAYGQGAKLLAKKLGTTVPEAMKFKRAFFQALPRVRALSNYLQTCIKTYGKMYSPMGRVFYIPAGFAYKGINAYAQGTAADVMKQALIDTEDLLVDYKSDINITVHDELMVDMEPSEAKILVPKICDVMSVVYPHRHIPLKVDVEYSDSSWGTKIKYVAA